MVSPGQRSFCCVVLAVGLTVLSACGGGRTADDIVEQDPAEQPTEAPPGVGEASEDDAELVDPDTAIVRENIDRDGELTTLFVGDSILVSISDDLAGRIDGDIVFDASSCRSLGQSASGCANSSADVTSGLYAIETSLGEFEPGAAPDVAVLILVSNSQVTADELDQAMELLEDVPRVWWVNARIQGYGRQNLNNLELIGLAGRNDRARIIDWYAASDEEGLFSDHVHPNDEGQALLAELIEDHLACDCEP